MTTEQPPPSHGQASLKDRWLVATSNPEGADLSMHKPAGEYAHTGWKRGLRERRRFRGHRRRFRLHVMLSAQLQLALMRAVAVKHLSKSMIVETALWRYLSRLVAYDPAKLIQRLKYANALVGELITTAMAVETAAGLSANIHDREARRQRRNQLSEKAYAAFDEVSNLAQAEAVAEANQMRAAMYRVLAQLAMMNAGLLNDAGEEEILAVIEKLRDEQLAFEDATKLLETETKESEQGK